MGRRKNPGFTRRYMYARHDSAQRNQLPIPIEACDKLLLLTDRLQHHPEEAFGPPATRRYYLSRMFHDAVGLNANETQATLDDFDDFCANTIIFSEYGPTKAAKYIVWYIKAWLYCPAFRNRSDETFLTVLADDLDDIDQIQTWMRAGDQGMFKSEQLETGYETNFDGSIRRNLLDKSYGEKELEKPVREREWKPRTAV